MRQYSDEFRQAAMKLAVSVGVHEAARTLRMPADALRAWCVSAGAPLPKLKKITRKYDPNVRALAQELLKEHTIHEVGDWLQVPEPTVAHWRLLALRADQRRAQRKYSKEVRDKAIELLVANGGKAAVVADLIDVKEGTLRNWWAQHRVATGRKEIGASRRVYPPEVKEAALDDVAQVGLVAAGRKHNISTRTLSGWLRSLGINARQYRSTVRPTADLDMSWVEDELPHLRVWRQLGSEWLKSQLRSVASKLGALRKFIRVYLAEKAVDHVDIADVVSVLSRSVQLPDFYETCCPRTSSGVVQNNHVSDFIDWILLARFSELDDFGRAQVTSAVHNPIPRRSSSGLPKKYESVHSPLPYGYLDELRTVIAEGPNYSDWKWAHQALGASLGSTGNVAPDWFEVSEEQIDKSDPDCVWRRRVRAQVAGGPLFEMWSPVRATALLIKLQLPLRTFQVRMLDSGEADTWRYETNGAGAVTWIENRSLLREGTPRNPVQQGVFRRVRGVTAQDSDALEIYCNTNKTHDSMSSASEKGYTFPWFTGMPQHANPFYWLEKLRNWQEKYNPVTRRTSWTELTGRHMNVKSSVQLSGYADACFLFRMPNSWSSDRHLPLVEGALDVLWYALLESFEERLARRGETHEDGSRVKLVNGAAASGARTTFFPLHSLRVSLITALALDGKVPFPVIQRLAGHSRLIMTLYYTKFSTERKQIELQEAAKRLELNKAGSIISFLRTASIETIVRDAISTDAQSLASVLPIHPAARTAAGWMPMHHGICLVGGNSSPLVDHRGSGGCFNGGPNIGTERSPNFGPVPGGAKNCVRCRWFLTEPHYLPALVAHFNVIMYHFDEARNDCVRYDAELAKLRTARITAEDAGERFERSHLIDEAERLFETAMQRFSERAEDAAACAKLIERCESALHNQISAAEGTRAMVSVGTLADVKAVVEEVESELLQLSGICDAIEIFPEERCEEAVLRRNQFLDRALLTDGLPGIFCTLSRETQLKAGGAFLRRLAAMQNPAEPQRGLRVVVGAIEAKRSLAELLGVDLASIAREAVESPKSLLRIGARS